MGFVPEPENLIFLSKKRAFGDFATKHVVGATRFQRKWLSYGLCPGTLSVDFLSKKRVFGDFASMRVVSLCPRFQ
jgi:hypothetical protein